MACNSGGTNHSCSNPNCQSKPPEPIFGKVMGFCVESKSPGTGYSMPYVIHALHLDQLIDLETQIKNEKKRRQDLITKHDLVNAASHKDVLVRFIEWEMAGPNKDRQESVYQAYINYLKDEMDKVK